MKYFLLLTGVSFTSIYLECIMTETIINGTVLLCQLVKQYTSAAEEEAMYLSLPERFLLVYPTPPPQIPPTTWVKKRA